MNGGTKQTTFNLPIHIHHWLQTYSAKLTSESDKKVTMKDIIIGGLLTTYPELKKVMSEEEVIVLVGKLQKGQTYGNKTC